MRRTCLLFFLDVYAHDLHHLNYTRKIGTTYTHIYIYTHTHSYFYFIIHTHTLSMCGATRKKGMNAIFSMVDYWDVLLIVCTLLACLHIMLLCARRKHELDSSAVQVQICQSPRRHQKPNQHKYVRASKRNSGNWGVHSSSSNTATHLHTQSSHSHENSPRRSRAKSDTNERSLKTKAMLEKEYEEARKKANAMFSQGSTCEQKTHATTLAQHKLRKDSSNNKMSCMYERVSLAQQQVPYESCTDLLT